VSQPKRAFDFGQARPPHPAAPGRAFAAAQARFVKGSQQLRLEDVAIWYSEFIGTMGESIPAKVRPALAFLARQPGKVDLDDFDKKKDPPVALVKWLEKFEDEYGDVTSVVDYEQDPPRRYYYEGVYRNNTGAFDQWDLGNSTVHAVPNDLDPGTHTELAHVTYKTDNIQNKRIDPGYGSNPGEFAKAFYLTTGHATAPQVAVSQKWGSDEKGYPKKVVRFRIPNGVLTKLVPGDAPGQALLLYMLQHASGYPALMSEAAAIQIMNRVNVLGSVLLFPDTKSSAVVIAQGTSKDWDTYTENNSASSDHFLVIGPQRPIALAGIRQIAVRGARGDYLINSVPRSLQTMG
jgi:hypothetical protein